MKLAKIKWYGNEVCENIILSSLEDILEYQQLLTRNTVDTFSYVAKNNIPVDRWDHYGSNGDYGNSFNLTIQTCKLSGGRPVLEFDKITNSKCLNMSKIINMGRDVVVNKNGGYCDFCPTRHEILEYCGDFKSSTNKAAVIKENTKYINLENDPVLERHSKDFLNKVDSNYSYVLRLCEFSKDELISVFKDFKSKGGEVVYVYTTGSNVSQMWEYCNAVIAAGLKNIVFEFNAGEIEGHQDLFEFLVNNSINLQYNYL